MKRLSGICPASLGLHQGEMRNVGNSAGLEPERRSAAIRYIRQALSAAAPVHERWVPTSATASKAAELKVASDYLNRALKILQDEQGKYWESAGPLDEAQRTLYRIGGAEVNEVLRLTKLANDEVTQQRPPGGGRVPT
jgi:hypothetical protein